MSTPPKSDDNVQIHEVWSDKVESEFTLIRKIVDDFPFIAMDIEFPGIFCKPLGIFKLSSDNNYATLKANVDMLKLIQLGLSFFDSLGNLPDCGTSRDCIWKFNFQEFHAKDDLSASDSIDLSWKSDNDFNKKNEEGINAFWFAELLMLPGIMLNDAIHWVTFHSR